MQNSFTYTTHSSPALHYDPRRCLTSALIHSLSKTEISTLTKDLIAHREDIALPMLVPTLLLAFRVKSASKMIRDSHQQIVEIEHITGIQTHW